MNTANQQPAEFFGWLSATPSKELLVSLLVWLICVLGVLTLLEFLNPERVGRRGRLRHMLHNQMFTFSSVAVLVLVLQLPFSSQFESAYRFGLFHWIDVPAVIQLLLMFVLIDLFYYAMHRASHHFMWLWRVHRTHHSDEQVDATTTYRTHVIEFFWLFAGKISIAVVLGINPVYTLTYDVLVGSLGAWYHSNVAISERVDRWLRSVFVTQRWHLSHHSANEHYTNQNYGTFFTVWDRLFATARMAPDPSQITFGITQLDGKRWQTFTGLWLTPFRTPHYKSSDSSNPASRDA